MEFSAAPRISSQSPTAVTPSLRASGGSTPRSRWGRSAAALCLSACLLSCSDDADDTSPSDGGSVVVTASAEALGLEGYAFPPRAGSEAFFADGWEVKFTKILVVVSDVTLSSGPDISPTDPSRLGSAVARLPGPFAVNLAAPGDVVGKGGGGERAWTLGTISEQNLLDGRAFDPTQRYAFGYSLVDASDAVTELRGIESTDPDWAEMKQQGWTHLLVGSATFKGTSCESSSESYDFSALPTQVNFRFGFEADVSMQNCQNPENSGAAFDGEEFQRGVQIKTGSQVTAQATIHTDHLFWNTVEHGAIALFDQFAAQARDQGGASELSLDDLVGVPLAPITDAADQPLAWRSCVDASEYTLPSTSAVSFDTHGNDSIHDLRDFLIFNASTMGHLNQDGLCFVPGVAHSHD